MLHIQEFINKHDNWETLLKRNPYNINIKRKDTRILFKYGIGSDFNNEIVRECRGLILEDVTLKTICCPFFKFGNYGESYIPDINWRQCRAQEKIDGSLINMYYYNGRWRISTTGCIDAIDAPLPTNLKYGNFQDLFMSTATKNNLRLNNLSVVNTYMFELVSPYNQVVIKYNDADIYHLATRNNNTLEEAIANIGIKHPNEYPLYTLSDCINYANNFNGHEGLVVVDNNWNRIKIKNPSYVAMHHMVNNHAINIEHIINMQENNDAEEFLNYFPEYKEDFIEIQSLTQKIIDDIQKVLDIYNTMYYNNRKEQAEYLLSTPFPDAGFAYIDGKCTDGISYWKLLRTAQKVKLLTKYKSNKQK